MRPHRRQPPAAFIVLSVVLTLCAAVSVTVGTRGAAGQNNCPIPTPTPAECDADGDGYANGSCGGSDCDDGNGSVHPDAPISCYGEGNDYNCNYVDDYTEAPCGGSPVLIDVAGDGFNLTDAAGGVRFDLNADGVREKRSWTAAGSDDAWLALDRNGHGRIDNGAELFGNFTRQPAAREPNGYLALAEFDRPEQGGNGDGVVDGRDAIFDWLRLWQDANHNGLAEPAEMHALPRLNVAALRLDYKESKRVDQYGNEFRFRAKIEAADPARIGRWSWDVFLLDATP